MDHETAEKLDAAERYALGELSPTDRDAFEEHLADCSRCMEDVWTGQTFAANVKAVFKDRAAEPEKKRARNWLDLFRLRPFPVLAFSGGLNIAMLAILGIGLFRVLPTLETRIHDGERVTASAVFRLRGMSRGPSQVFAVNAWSYAVVRLDVPHHYRQYSYSIEDGSGHVRRTGPLAVPGDAE